MINPFTTTTPPIVAAFERIRTEAPPRSKAAMILAEAGGHIVLASPVGDEEDQKKPWDVRTQAEKDKDKADLGPGREKGGAWAATSDLDRLRLLIDRATSRSGGTPPNIGLNVGMSGLIAVDADQAKDVSEVQAAACPEDPLSYVPTTWTPGVVTRDGKVRHKGGAHFLYYDDIGVELPGGGAKFGTNTDVFTHEGRYVMVPPSERNGRPYTVAGPIRPLSSAPWLVEFLSQKAEERAAQDEARRERVEASQNVLRDAPGSIDAWNNSVTWEDLLNKVGWEVNDDRDGCGCPTWYIPEHGNRRSAVAHEPGCTEPSVDATSGSGPLHFWTSDLPEELERWAEANPGTGEYLRVSKAQFSAAMWHEGSMEAFLEAEGLSAAYEPWDTSTARLAAPEGVSPEREDEFWNSRETFRKIREAARLRRVSPWATLLAVLALTSYTVPPYVMLPAARGARSPLNLFVGLVGASGDGKGGATDLAYELLTGLPEVNTTTFGSGEGVLHQYGYRPSGKDARTYGATYRKSASALFDVREITSLYNMNSREGNSVVANMLIGWSGETLTTKGYVDKEKTLVIPARSYRMVAVFGVQPDRIAGLFAQAEVGLPQRVLFGPATPRPEDLGPLELVDTSAEDISDSWGADSQGEDLDTDALPDHLRIDLSHITDHLPDRHPYGYHNLEDAPAHIRPFGAPDPEEDDDDDDPDKAWYGQYPRYDEFDPSTHHVVRLTGEALNELRRETHIRATRPEGYVETTAEAIAGHRHLMKRRLASLLSFLGGGNGNVTQEMWGLAQVVLAKNDEVIYDVMKRAEVKRVAGAEMEGTVQGIRTAKAAEVVAERAGEDALKVRNRIVSVLRKAEDEWVLYATVRRAVAKRLRPLTDSALDDLMDEGVVTAMEGEKSANGKVPVLYKMA